MPRKYQSPFSDRPNRNNKLGVKGVSWHPGAQRYSVAKTIDGVRYHLGYVDTPEQGRKLWEGAYTRPDVPNTVFLTPPPQDLTSGFKQALTHLIAEGKTAEAANIQSVIERIEAQLATGVKPSDVRL